MNLSESPLDSHLKEALDAAEDDDARYHLREALQLRVIQEESGDDPISV